MMTSQSTIRISREVTTLQKASDLSLAVSYADHNIRKVRALIVGPPGTPYEFGFFEFSVQFDQDYPNKAPTVKALTTNKGRTRFNPNIYADGKVCLSILGTWHGQSGESWSAAQNLESILLSIQSLMGSNPFANEPGFENMISKEDKEKAKAYVLKIQHESIRISVLEPLEAALSIGPAQISNEDEDEVEWNPFTDLRKRRFMWYYASYIHSIDKTVKDNGDAVVDGRLFRSMPFEGVNNGMAGSFCYSNLKKRLGCLRKRIDSETNELEAEGLQRAKDESPYALFFSQKFAAVKQNMTQASLPVDLELVDENPFAWRLTLWGRPMTNLDGGMFKIKIVFPVRFPELQPRVRVETPIFHQRVTTDGILAYVPVKHDEAESHVSAIMSAIEEENPPYDPRMVVNHEASALRWGTPDDRKVYNRKLRRSAQDSSEY